MHITWQVRARVDMSHTRQYIEQHNPEGARRVVRTIYETVGRLTAAPHLGRPGRVERTRELVVAHTPYIVAYSVDGDRIIILAVMHGAQDWPDSF